MPETAQRDDRATLGDGSLDVLELERLVRERDPSARLVQRRILRRVVRESRDGGFLGGTTSKRMSYAVRVEQARESLNRDEVGLGPLDAWPDPLVLLVRPEPNELTPRPRQQVLLRYWRLLFHARVQAECLKRLQQRGGNLERLRQWIDQIGQTQFDEILSVLREEDYLDDGDDLTTAVSEFAALYGELRWFDPDWVGAFFPALGEQSRTDALIAELVDLEVIFERTRLSGAGLPSEELEQEASTSQPQPASAPDANRSPREPGLLSRFRSGRLVKRADFEGRRRNHVRAAICRRRAARLVSPVSQSTMKAAAYQQLGLLCQALAAATEGGPSATARWEEALAPLLEHADRGGWVAEARLLYDLQKVVLDWNRSFYALDLMEWVLTLGQRPVMRPLPLHPEVMRVSHLRSASRRLTRVRIPPREQLILAALINESIEHAENVVRSRFRPVLSSALHDMGWLPRNVPEQVATEKLTEEILDRVVERGYLSFSELRDTISRNMLKLDDLSGPLEVVRGDRLLQTDHALAVALDGVYRRGEVYLRALQRFSAIPFGTPIGRLLTRYVALPFFAAYIFLKFPDVIIHYVREWMGLSPIHIFETFTFLGTGLFLSGLFNFAEFRKVVLDGLTLGYRTARWLFIGVPTWLMKHPLMSRLMRSRGFRRLTRWVLQPVSIYLASLGILLLLGVPRLDAEIAAGFAFVLALILLNSRVGRDVEEIIADRALRDWQRMWYDWFPGLVRLVMEFFDHLVQAVERVLYTIDEWLRFKSEQGPLALASKAIIGVFWFFVTYLVRVYLNLLIEPQLNPIKHFPVVTVAHKVMIPLLPTLYHLLRAPLLPLVGPWIADPFVAFTIFWLPGIFGFLVWELKENWKLYEANRQPTLKPVMVGHHGETVARYLRPGFHSGTVPKLFRKLRRQAVTAPGQSPRPATRRLRMRLEEVQHEIQRLVERELLALWRHSREGQQVAWRAGAVSLATNHIRVNLTRSDDPTRHCQILFEEQSGWLLASLTEASGLADLGRLPRAAMHDALAGFYKYAAVDLTREQILAFLGDQRMAYDISDRGLLVWPARDYRTEIVYDLNRSHPTASIMPATWRATLPLGIEGDRLVFSRVPIPWSRWVSCWEDDRAGLGHASRILPQFRLLPGERIQPA